jgi:hypothetical protein
MASVEPRKIFVIRTVGLDDFKEITLFRQLEKGARHGDDLRVDVHRHADGFRQVFVDEAGKGAAAQADLQDMARVVVPQQKAIMARL